MKKLCCLLLLSVCFLLSLSDVVCAGNFTVLADTGVLNLKDDQKWEKTYKTSEGKFKVRFRKLWNSSEKKRYHLIIWWDDKRIADGYCPKNDSGYSFHIYQEHPTSRIFVALETPLRVVLMGYEPWNGRLEKYIDSKGYYSTGRYPQLYLHKDGNLHLSFTNERGQHCNEYKMTWDEDARWFGYRDMTAPAATPSYEEPEEDDEPTYSEPESEPEAPAAEPAAASAQPQTAPATTPADTSVLEEEELYYTEAATKT